MVAHALTASAAIFACVQLATPGRTVTQVRHLIKTCHSAIEVDEIYFCSSSNCNFCQVLATVARILVKMVAHALTASAAIFACVQLATPGRTVTQVRHLIENLPFCG